MAERRLLRLAALGLAGALAALLWSGYAQDIRRARARVASGSEIALTRCGPIEYARIGQGPAVLFVHGAGGGFDQGLDMARELARHGLQVVLMSRFGYLRTPLPADASPEAQADAHACLLDALGIGSAAVVGASAGAPSSLQFALRHPRRTRALVLLVPATWEPSRGTGAAAPAATPFVFDTALRSDFLFWAATRVARETLIESVLATPPQLVRQAAPAERQRVEALLANILPVSARRLGLLNDARVVSALARYPLQRIAAPTLLVSVRDDGFGTWASARYTASQIPGARFVGWERGGHVWVGHHEEMMSLLHEFLAAAPGP